MTINVDIPDTYAGQLAHMPPALLRERLEEAFLAILEEAEKTDTVTDEDTVTDANQLLSLYGAAAGGPGAIGTEVEGYIVALRDEWGSRETQWERPYKNPRCSTISNCPCPSL